MTKMRRTAFFALGVASLVSSGATAEPAVVPFETFANHVLLPVEIAGRGPFHLILDTGMPLEGAVVFSGPKASSLLAGRDTEESPGCGDASGAQLSGVTLALPGIVLADQSVTIVPAPWSPAESRSMRAEGIIGLSLFERYVVRMDHEKQLASFVEPADFRHDGVGEVLSIPRDSFGIPQVECEVELADGTVVLTHLVLDTGASHALSLHVGSLEAIRLPPNAVPGRLGRTMYGEVLGHFGRVARVCLSGMCLENVVTSLSEGEPICASEAGNQGNLGNQALQRFHVTIDYSRAQMILEPNGRYREPFEHDMAGITFGRTDEGWLAVDRVLPGSAASDSGLEAGDVVLTVDGRPASELDQDAVRRLVRQEGATLSVRLKRGQEERTVELRLRRLI